MINCEPNNAPYLATLSSLAYYKRVMASKERVSAVIEGGDLRDVLRVVQDLISRLDNVTNAAEANSLAMRVDVL